MLDAVILGLVEGITEFLPISSTGHLILVSNLLGLENGAQEAQIDAFNIMIQGGAILAVLGVYWPRVKMMIAGTFGRNAPGLKLAINLFVAFLPAAVFGVLLNDWIKERLFHPTPVILALFLGGVALLLLRKWQRRFFHGNGDEVPSSRSIVDIEHLTWRRALIIGLLQCLAMWPGTSRSMMTIIGGMLVGMRPKHAAEFSFLLGLPTLGGACVYEGYNNFVENDTNILQDLGLANVIVGFVVATIAAAIAVKWLIAYLNHHGVAAFGWYRIALAAVMTALIALNVVTLHPRVSEPERTDSPPHNPPTEMNHESVDDSSDSFAIRSA